jgi:hypothetical protein
VTKPVIAGHYLCLNGVGVKPEIVKNALWQDSTKLSGWIKQETQEWSGLSESNRHLNLGKVPYYHYTKAASLYFLYL